MSLETWALALRSSARITGALVFVNVPASIAWSALLSGYVDFPSRVWNLACFFVYLNCFAWSLVLWKVMTIKWTKTFVWFIGLGSLLAVFIWIKIFQPLYNPLYANALYVWILINYVSIFTVWRLINIHSPFKRLVKVEHVYDPETRCVMTTVTNVSEKHHTFTIQEASYKAFFVEDGERHYVLNCAVPELKDVELNPKESARCCFKRPNIQQMAAPYQEFVLVVDGRMSIYAPLALMHI